MTKSDELAKAWLSKPLPILLSQALEIYFENHVNGQKEKFQKGVIKRWKHVYDVTGGDIPLDDVTRDMGRRYVRHRLKSVKTGTIERELKTIRAVINKTIIERSLKITNVFERLSIPNKGGDKKVREDFEISELSSILKGCVAKGDDIRILILVACLTGARPSEIAGLRREDVYLNDPIPHIDIVEYASRTLKTKSSLRKVPLIPLAAKWLGKLLNSHQDEAVFTRYCDGFEVFGDNVSATTSKYIKTYANNKSLYSGRHTTKTLLDQANTPEHLSEAIGGWGKASISRGYGTGHSLKQKYDALIEAFKPLVNEEIILS
ncbi:tyrosine-type recombinase/integrase [Polynucleobacter parvulilacunae]|uniref:tyrosine-type recombinase/integrase n=1 Tax=Polynucleobacter parvulilacunae TaxID=1855631 RepID=UPI003F6E58C2